MKKIIITGITGQDGIHLAKLLLEKSTNDFIYGIGRNIQEKLFFEKLKSITTNYPNHSNLKLIKIKKFKEVKQLIIDISPDQIYHLSGPSSVYESIKHPDDKNTIVENFEYIINSILKINKKCSIFHASSSEMFAPSDLPLNEYSDMKPNSPYAFGKLENHQKIKAFSQNSKINAVSGIMFNHESEFRSNNYLVMKIILAAIKISRGESDSLTLGSLDYVRDWSYAGDIAEAIYLTTNYGESSDYVLGSGIGTTIKDLVNYVFDYFNLEWENYIEIDKSFLRQNDPIKVISDPKKIYSELNWKNRIDIYNLLDRCIESRLS